MACPTCDHTMKALCQAEGCVYYWCSRCGTVRRIGFDIVADIVPKLVERCRAFVDDPSVDGRSFQLCHGLGIIEAVLPRGLRPDEGKEPS
jgi:hypothetical protein